MSYSRQKAYGQNFLVSSEVIQAIVSKVDHTCAKTSVSHVLEIGPGKQALTKPLAKLLAPQVQFHLIEKDPLLIPALKNLQDQFDHVVVYPQDALLFESYPIEPFGLVSNLPYSCSVALLDRFARQKNCQFMVLMFQKEVADRILAPPHNRERGSLSVFIQNLWSVSAFLNVPPSAFTPPPRVDSSVLFFERKKADVELTSEQERKWDQFLKTLFSHPRKMIRSLPFLKPLLGSGLSGEERPFQLTQQQIIRLFLEIYCSSKNVGNNDSFG